MRQVNLGKGRPAVEQSTETLRVVRDRYRDGTATSTDVIDAETARTRPEQRYVPARIESLSAQARLVYVLGDDPGTLCLTLADARDTLPEALPMPRPATEQKSDEKKPDELPMPHRAP